MHVFQINNWKIKFIYITSVNYKPVSGLLVFIILTVQKRASKNELKFAWPVIFYRSEMVQHGKKP